MHVCVYVCTYVQLHMYLSVEAQGQLWMSFVRNHSLSFFLFLFFPWGRDHRPGVCWLGLVGWQASPRVLPFSSFWVSNSGICGKHFTYSAHPSSPAAAFLSAMHFCLFLHSCHLVLSSLRYISFPCLSTSLFYLQVFKVLYFRPFTLKTTTTKHTLWLVILSVCLTCPVPGWTNLYL